MASDLVYGTYYEFKIEARNLYGYSSASEILTILSAFSPPAPTIVQTALELTTLTVSWNLATDNGSPITQFKVFIR